MSDYVDFNIVDSQCDECIYNNKEHISEICPKNNIDDIKANIINCPFKQIVRVN